MDRFADPGQSHLVHHGDRELADQLAGVGGDDRAAQDPVGPPGDVHLHESLVFPVGDGAVHLVQGHPEGIDLDPGRLGVALVHAHVGDLRVGVGAPGHDQGRELLGAQEERVLHHDLGSGVGGVGELPVHADVAGRVDLWVRGLEVVVHVDAPPIVVRHAGLLEAQALDVRCATDAQQDPIHGHLCGSAPRLREVDHPLVPALRDAFDRRLVDHADALVGEALLDDGGRVGVLAREEVGVVVEDHHLGPQAPEGLGHLAADRSGSDHPESARAFGQVEDRLVGQVARLGKPLDGQGDGAGAGGDHGLLETQPAARHLQRLPVGEVGVSEEDVDSQLVPVALGGVLGADLCAQASHSLEGGAEVGLGSGSQCQTDLLLGPARLVDHPRRADHALRGYAADVETVAAEVVALDQRHLRAQSGGDRRTDESGAAGTDHHEVVTPAGLGVPPAGGVHVLQELLVVRIERLDDGQIGHA